MSFQPKRDVWLISDTHLLHSNCLRFLDKNGRKFRGDRFATTKEMDSTILENWNKVVKPGDKVYHLGDVFIGCKSIFKGLWPKFNGKKTLIVGNHDDIKFMSSGGFFSKIQMWKKIPEMDMILTHVPIHESSLSKKTPFNVHGHIHEKHSPTLVHYNVSVEAIDYTPIHIEEVRDELRKINGVKI